MDVTLAVNNLHNATMFRVRQCYFALRKEPDKRHDHEKEVLKEIEDNLDQMNAPKLTKDGKPKQTRKKKTEEKAEGKDPKEPAAPDEPEGPRYEMPTAEKPILPYQFLNELMRVTKNPDYCDPRLGRQTAQAVLKEVPESFFDYFKACASYAKDSSNFTGKPKFPGYLKKGGMHTATLSNIECELRSAEELSTLNANFVAKNQPGLQYHTGLKDADMKFNPEHMYLKLPKTRLVCDIGPIDVSNVRLIEVKIVPHHGVFTLSVTLDTEMEKKSFETSKKRKQQRKDEKKQEKEEGIPPLPEGVPLRACSVDMGVENIMAVTNNIGAECLLYKGGALKSINQFYNKRAAQIISGQTKGTTNKFKPTPEFNELTARRNNQISDFMHKTAKQFMQWCVGHQINTIIIGHNPLWKQKSNMGDINNQNFVQIPFNKLISIIQYLAEREGIRVILQEESYTSLASFLDRDPIPVYKKDDPTKDKKDDSTEDKKDDSSERKKNNKPKYKFSGVRGPTNWDGRRKVQKLDRTTGIRKTTNPKFRGLYYSEKKKKYINSDLNGSANTGRKAIPEMYDPGVGQEPDFDNCTVVRYPDQEHFLKNRNRQKEAFNAAHPLTWTDDKGKTRHIGRRTLKRRHRKQNAGKSA